jgi:hypothetical protein
MLDSIGESVVRTTTRADNNLAVENKDVDLKKVEKTVEERPIENTRESDASGNDAGKKTGGYDADDSGVFFEKYDEKGNVIYRLPPEQKPIDELA